MAYRRSLTIRAKLFNQQRFGPSFSYIHHQNDSEKSNSPVENSKINNFLQNRSFGSSGNTLGGFNTFFRDRGSRNSMMNGSFIVRHMSTTIGDGAEKIEYITDVAGVLSDNTVDAVVSQAPAVSEVGVAAADSYFPVAALQYLIDGIHNYTGLPWWGSIAVTTLLIRGLAIPLMINQLKATSKLTLMRPKLEEIKQEMENRAMNPTAVAEGQQRMSKIFKEYGVTPWTPLKGILIQGPVFVSFFLGIQNMVDKVPSFKEGGAFWFTDLTTPDSFYVLPILTALSFWITVESNMQEGLEGNPAGGTMKNVSRVFAVLTVPITLNFPKALFCYWITSNLFSLVYGLVIKAPGVKKFLGVPIIPVAPSTTTQQPAFSFTEALKKYVQSQQRAAPSKPASSIPTTHASKPVTKKIPSSSVLSQRIRSLENEVKGRKKGKKRWGSIAVTTVLIRGLAVPLMINQLKATSKLTGMNPTAVAEGPQLMSKIFKEYGVTPWIPLKGILIQGPVFVSFFLGIVNMVYKVPSFKEGGAFWFTDLTTPDSLCVLPVLTALSFWIAMEVWKAILLEEQ